MYYQIFTTFASLAWAEFMTFRRAFMTTWMANSWITIISMFLDYVKSLSWLNCLSPSKITDNLFLFTNMNGVGNFWLLSISFQFFIRYWWGTIFHYNVFLICYDSTIPLLGRNIYTWTVAEKRFVVTIPNRNRMSPFWRRYFRL